MMAWRRWARSRSRRSAAVMAVILTSLGHVAALDISLIEALASLERRKGLAMTTDHQQLAERYLTMLNQHDPDAVEGFVAVGYINHNPRVEDGRQANRGFWAAVPDLTSTMDAAIEAGDRVAGRSTSRATHRGPLYGMPPTGGPVEMRSIDIWRVHDGEFAEHCDAVNLRAV